MAELHPTPMLDELEKGPWPSFVTDIKRMALQGKAACADLLGQLELSYKDNEGHWKHGGIVGVLGYGGGVIGRYSDVPALFPGVEHFHTLRVNQPAAKYYHSDSLRKVMDVWKRRGSGMVNLHGSTGDIILLGAFTDELENIFSELTALGWDLGGSGSALRTPSACLGKSRCEWACIHAEEICYELTMAFQDELHRPAWPYKFKFKVDGCPNCCVASLARSDCAIIGTWQDDIRIDQIAIAEYVNGNFSAEGGAHGQHIKLNIQRDIIDLCPTHCISYENKKLIIDNKECTRCMHCINMMPRALRPGSETGASILIGAKAPILEGAQLGSVVIPFMPMEFPYNEFKEFAEKMWEWWDENGKNRERIGETIQRLGLATFLSAVEVEPDPRQVKEPRSNPYIFYKEEEVAGGFERNIEDYRKRHAR